MNFWQLLFLWLVSVLIALGLGFKWGMSYAARYKEAELKAALADFWSDRGFAREGDVQKPPPRFENA